MTVLKQGFPTASLGVFAWRSILKYDVFLSHASEDKGNLVRSLSALLKAFGVKVWYDEFSLKVGDSLSRSIDKGLSGSNYGVVVLSKFFVKKDWTDYELRGLLAKELGKGKVILPVWHEISRDDVLEFSPTLADKFALTTGGQTDINIAVKIIEVVRPDLFEKIMRRAAYLKAQSNGKIEQVEISKIQFGPPKHEELPFFLVSRVRLIRASLLEVYPHSMKYWLDGFRGDAHPTKEIRIWEHISSCYLEFVSMVKLSHEQRITTCKILQAISCSVDLEQLNQEFATLPEGAKEKIVNLWKYPVPVYEFEDEAFPLDYESTEKEQENLKTGDTESFPYDVPDELVYDFLGQKPADEDA